MKTSKGLAGGGPAAIIAKVAPAAGVLILLAVLYFIGPAQIISALVKARPVYIAGGIVSILCASSIRIYKWKLMRDRMGAEIGLAELCAMFFSSKFWGMVSPMRSGEAAPALAGGGQRGKIMSLVVYDRVIETFQTLAVFAALFVLYYGVFFEAGTGIGLALVTGIVVVAAFVVFYERAGLLVFSLSDRLLALFPRTGPAVRLARISESLKSDMNEYYSSVRNYFRLGFTLRLTAVTFLAWGFEVGFWFMMFKAAGADVPFWVVLVSVVVFSIVGAMAPIPGGLGASDMSLALIVGHFGYSAEAGAIIILFRVVSFTYIYLGYAVFGTRFWAKT